MKSAYELALERLGGEPIKKLSDNQKERIAEVDRVYQAKIAEAKLMSEERLKKANHDDIKQIQDDLTVELASLHERMEREKEKIRNEN